MFFECFFSGVNDTRVKNENVKIRETRRLVCNVNTNFSAVISVICFIVAYYCFFTAEPVARL